MNSDMNTFGNQESLQEGTFSFIIKLMGYRNQLRMNHWQTESFSEHKLTDEILGSLDSYIDKIGEVSIGMFGRPQINTVSINLSDIRISSTKFVLDQMDQELSQLVECYKVTNFEGMISTLGDFSADIKKFKYLLTLK